MRLRSEFWLTGNETSVHEQEHMLCYEIKKKKNPKSSERNVSENINEACAKSFIKTKSKNISFILKRVQIFIVFKFANCDDQTKNPN